MEMRYCSSCGKEQPTTQSKPKRGRKFRCGFCTWRLKRLQVVSPQSLYYQPKVRPDFSTVEAVMGEDGKPMLRVKQPSDSGTTLR